MNGKNSVIHRKAQFARREFDARGMSTSKALRIALARVADRHYDLPLVVSTVEQVATSQANLKDHFADEGLLVLLDGAEPSCGALCLDTQFLTALIEVQTIGQVRHAQAQPRPVTRTDAAICAPFIDKLLEAVRAQLESASPKMRSARYRYGDMAEDARTLTLALDGPDYEVFRLSVDLANGAKSGLLTVIFPTEPNDRSMDSNGLASGESSGASNLGDVVRNAPVTLNAVLDRLEMPLREACNLEVGMCFPIAPTALTDARLTATGGHVVARVSLGQLNGFRAARLAPDRNGSLPQAPVDATQKSIVDPERVTKSPASTNGLSPLASGGAESSREKLDTSLKSESGNLEEAFNEIPGSENELEESS